MLDFPDELAGENLLIVTKGQLIQVQKKRADGWSYGFVLYGGPTGFMADGANGGPVIKANAKVSHASKSEDADSLHRSGWFHEGFVQQPTAQQMKDLQDSLGGQKEAVDALAPPPSWTGEIDPLNVQLVEIDVKSDEYKVAVGKFMGTLGNAKGVQVKSLKRVQNLALWQSYAAYRKTLLLRAEAEGIDAGRLAKYELPSVFHGSSAFAIPKIAQQGFQRNFAGKNATAYGRGNYFALNSSYSAHDVYTAPDSKGVKRMFIARAMVGETCLGDESTIVPSERKPNILFDSTTDHLRKPQLYVTYHDAQAYPEYLIEFTRRS